MTRRRAIVFGVHPWSGPFQLGAHHLARALQRHGFEVLYIAPPLSPPHAAAAPFSTDIRRRWREFWAPPQTEVGVITPFTFLPLSGRWGAGNPRNLETWPHHTAPSFKRTLHRLGFDAPDLAILDGPLQLAGARMARPRTLVLRVFDRFAHMPGITNALRDAHFLAAREADLVVYSARTLARDVEALAPRRAMLLANGVDAAHFAAPRQMPAAYAQIPRPRIVYVGQTGPLFDGNLVAALAKRCSDWSFVIIGPKPNIAALHAGSNVHLLGPARWEALPALLQHADAGLVPFSVAQFPTFVEGVNPLKIHEYLASGLPVAATRWQELETLSAPSLHLATPERLEEAISAALADPINSEDRRRYAKLSGWDVRVLTLLEAVGLGDADQIE